MKPFYATILAALFLTVTPVLVEESKIDMKKLSCKQFSGYDKDNVSIIMMWLEGYTPRRRGCHHRFRQDARRHSDRLLRRPS